MARAIHAIGAKGYESREQRAALARVRRQHGRPLQTIRGGAKTTRGHHLRRRPGVHRRRAHLPDATRTRGHGGVHGARAQGSTRGGRLHAPGLRVRSRREERETHAVAPGTARPFQPVPAA